MKYSGFSAGSAIFWGGLIAGVLDIAAVFAFWAAKDLSPVTILQSIATSRLGEPAFEGGAPAAFTGLALHFGVSFVFAAGYVVAASKASILRSRPVLFGLLYGLLAYAVMTFVVVPASHATFDSPWPPPLVNLAASLGIHLFLFGLPIALAASRMDPDKIAARPAPKGLSFSAGSAVFWGGLIAGVLDISAVFAFWAARDVAPVTILQSIASSLLGREAFEGRLSAAGIGLFLHFFVSFVFAAGFVVVSARAQIMRFHPVIFGLVYGLVVHWIMSEIVVPLSLAEFGARLPSPESYARTLFIHMVLFGLPIALAAGRIRR